MPVGYIISTDMGNWREWPRPLFSRAHSLTGKPDYLVGDGPQLIPVEVKSGHAPKQPYPSHVLQLAAYCLLVEECFQIRPTYGIICYTDRSFKVDYTRGLRTELLKVLRRMRADLARGTADRNHNQPERCRHCGYLRYCDQALL